MQKKINQAETAGFTIPVERPRNKENRWKMIEKKRDMFLIKMLIGHKEQMSNQLENWSTLRDDGLKLSEKMLADDIRNFIEFFKLNSDEANEAQKEADAQAKTRQNKATELKDK